MKRLVLCISLLMLIGASSVISLNSLKNRTLYFSENISQIYSLYTDEKYDEASAKTRKLYAEWIDFCDTASVMVDLDRLEEINSSFAKLMPYISVQSDETEAELSSLSKRINRLYDAEKPTWFNIF